MIYRADSGNRTHTLTLEVLHTNLYTIPAKEPLVGIEPTSSEYKTEIINLYTKEAL
nr:MAG: hypothetical protein [Bacteriophage sp.]UWG27152.1 MAG: hypothetical protein [Bacteriophage sp.]